MDHRLGSTIRKNSADFFLKRRFKKKRRIAQIAHGVGLATIEVGALGSGAGFVCSMCN